MSILVTEWCKQEGLIRKDEKWYNVKWNSGKVVEKGSKKVLWDFQFKSRKENTRRRPDVIIEDMAKKCIYGLLIWHVQWNAT